MDQVWIFSLILSFYDCRGIAMPFEMQHDFRDRVPIFHEEHGRVEEPKTRVDQLRALLNHVLR